MMLRFPSEFSKVTKFSENIGACQSLAKACSTSGKNGTFERLLSESSINIGDFDERENGRGYRSHRGRGNHQRQIGPFRPVPNLTQWSPVGRYRRAARLAGVAQVSKWGTGRPKRSQNGTTYYPNKQRARPLYYTWCDMRTRCNWAGDPQYYRYGGRGIKVCERWASFEAFVADMGPKPTPDHTLERNDNNGNYEPSNCRWATRQEQACNTRRTRLITIDGETAPMKVWMERLHLSSATLKHLYFGVPMPRRTEAQKQRRRELEGSRKRLQHTSEGPQ